ncbi:hypothetical protein OAK91_02975 [Planctomycetaceae bacterium]|nr:hypothetical protein [bacterium]MDB4786545.1 hypothetical protein [Planctomycetaceae bacterium]MDC0273675.1 hypothetical protein [Planctomycetaceae bacterium]
MNSGFTGSASQDDRRRRRLLSEQNEDGVDQVTLAMTREIAESSRNHRYPIKRILHYKLWRLWLIATIMATALGGILYGTWIVGQEELNPFMEILFAESGGRIYPAILAALLLIAGQISWLIGWARSRGPNDFRGSFRVWTPIGLFFYLLSLSVVVRADEIVNASITHAGLDMPWAVPAWNWLIPLAGATSLILWIVNGEMRTSRISRIHLWLGMVCLVAGSALPYVAELQIPGLALLGLTLGGMMMVCQSLLWFGRQVLYISADPAERKPSVTLKVLKSLFQRKPGNKVKKTKASQTTSAKSDQDETPESPVKTRRRGRKKPTNPKPEKTVSEKSITPEAALPEEEKKTSAKAEKPRIRLRAEDITVTSVDADILKERLDLMELLVEEGEEFDQDLLKGMTKKQKKQLRSAWRDLEREYSALRAG